MTLRLSDPERRSGALDPEHLRLAVDLVRVDGYLIIEDVVPRELVAELRDDFDELAAAHAREHAIDPQRPYAGWQPPRRLPYLHPLVLDNPIMHQVCAALFDGRYHLGKFSSNTSYPGGTLPQGIHTDHSPFYPASPDLLLPVYRVSVNLPLCDFTPETGATELWPGGTHHAPIDAKDHDRLERLAEHMHSRLACMPAGSLLIRDSRMWHRATPNRSDRPRSMLCYSFRRDFGEYAAPALELAAAPGTPSPRPMATDA